MATAKRVELSVENLDNVAGGNGIMEAIKKFIKDNPEVIKHGIDWVKNLFNKKGGDKKDASSGGSGGGGNTYTNNNQGGKQNNNQQGNENKNSSKGNSIAELNLI